MALLVKYGTDLGMDREVLRFRALTKAEQEPDNKKTVNILTVWHQRANSPSAILETAVMAGQARNGRLGQPRNEPEILGTGSA